MFIGDHSGQVTILKLEQENCTLVTTFRGHTGGIESRPSMCCSHSDLSPAACSDVHKMWCASDEVQSGLVQRYTWCVWLISEWFSKNGSVRYNVRNFLHQSNKRANSLFQKWWWCGSLSCYAGESPCLHMLMRHCLRLCGNCTNSWTEGQLPPSVLAILGARKWYARQTPTSKTNEMKNRFVVGS